MARPHAPAPMDGICHLCGYQTHPGGGCASHPCHRCAHPGTVRADGTRGYDPRQYNACLCPCHRHYIAAREALILAGGMSTMSPPKRAIGAHVPTEQDWDQPADG